MPDADASSNSPGSTALRWLGCLVAPAVVCATYVGALRLFGVDADPAVGWMHRTVGVGALLFTVVGISMAGEGFIEDAVKFALFGVLGAFVARGMEPPLAAMWLGVVAGSTLSFAARAVERIARRVSAPAGSPEAARPPTNDPP